VLDNEKLEICEMRQRDYLSGWKDGGRCTSLNEDIQVVSNQGIRCRDEMRKLMWAETCIPGM